MSKVEKIVPRTVNCNNIEQITNREPNSLCQSFKNCFVAKHVLKRDCDTILPKLTLYNLTYLLPSVDSPIPQSNKCYD